MPSKIEWTDETINPYPGCTKIAAGCLNCYAERRAHRLASMGRKAYKVTITDKHWNGHIGFQPEHLTLPLSWRKGRRIFVNSMGDLFHEAICFHRIRDVWELMRKTERHTYLILTKRIKAAKSFAEWLKEDWSEKFALPNVWLGVSCSTQVDVDKNIPILLQIPAAVHFVSFEPLLEDINCRLPDKYVPYAKEMRMAGGRHHTGQSLLRGLDQVIVGGESGPGARTMHPEWPRDLRDQCVEAGVAFFFKQWGEWLHKSYLDYLPGIGHSEIDLEHGDYSFDIEGSLCRLRSPKKGSGPALAGELYLTKLDCVDGYYRVGKKKAGRVLDGRTWDEYPI